MSDTFLCWSRCFIVLLLTMWSRSLLATQDDEPKKPVKIDKWDGAAVKNALDDAVKKALLDGFSCEESHSLMDGRLVICTVAVGFALFALAWDYLNPFPLSKPVLIMCVLSYFLLMGVLTLYTTFTERGCFLVALERDQAGVDPDNTFRALSTLKRYDDIYRLTLTYTDGSSQQTRSADMSKCVADFFDENGYICYDLFEPAVRSLALSLRTGKKEK